MVSSTRASWARRCVEVFTGAALVSVVLAPGAAAQSDPFPRPTPSVDPCLEPGGIEDCLFPPTPSPEPSPTPTAPPPPPPTEDDGDDGPGGVVGWIVDGITDAINGFFRALVTDALNPLLDLLGRTLLSTPTVGSLPRVAELWEASRLFAVAAYVLLVMIAGIVVMAHETVQTRYSVKEIAPRIVLGFLAVNLSLMLADQAIGLANAAAQAVLGEGMNPEEAADTLTTLVMGALDGGGIFIIFIGLALAAALVALLITYVVRVALTIILIAGAPLALACHALPQTEGVARWWWRIFAGVLAIQVAQSLTLVTALSVFFAPGGFTIFGPTTDGLVNLIVTLALFYILIKIPFWILQQVQVGGRSFVGGAVKGYLAYKTLGILRGRGNHSTPTRPSPPGPSSSGGRSGSGGIGPRPGGTATPPPAGSSTPGPASPRSGPGGRGPAPAAARGADRLASVRDRLIVTSRRQSAATATADTSGERPVPGGWPQPGRARREPAHDAGPQRPTSRPVRRAPADPRTDGAETHRPVRTSAQRSHRTTGGQTVPCRPGPTGSADTPPPRRPASSSSARPPAPRRRPPSTSPTTQRTPAPRPAPRRASTTPSRPVPPPTAHGAGRTPPRPASPPSPHRPGDERS